MLFQPDKKRTIKRGNRQGLLFLIDYEMAVGVGLRQELWELYYGPLLVGPPHSLVELVTVDTPETVPLLSPLSPLPSLPGLLLLGLAQQFNSIQCLPALIALLELPELKAEVRVLFGRLCLLEGLIAGSDSQQKPRFTIALPLQLAESRLLFSWQSHDCSK